MKLEEKLKKTSRVATSLAVGVLVVYGSNKLGITQKIMDVVCPLFTHGTSQGKEFFFPFGKIIYNSGLGTLTSIFIYDVLVNYSMQNKTKSPTI